MDKDRRAHLQSLWLQFLENITDYQGIIDGLHTENILTKPLKEKVEAKQGSDQLRVILDILPRRGNRAFDVFYQVLVNSGEDIAADLLCPELSEQRKTQRVKKHVPPSGVQESYQDTMQPVSDDDELPDKWPDIDVHDPFRVSVVNVGKDAVMRARFEKAASGGGAVYPVHKPVRGIFLLVSNQFFKEARSNKVDLADRDGTGKDCLALDQLFKQLGFHVVIKNNCSAEEIMEAVRAQSLDDHTNYDCFACAVLTHGERDKVYGVDGKLLSLDEIKDAMDGDNCPTLIGKPKLFFIQACQGEKYDSGSGAAGGFGAAGPNPQPADEAKEMHKVVDKFLNIDIRDKTESDVAKETRVSPKSDSFVAMATIPDYVSWRNTEWGTWFVQAVVYVFSHWAHKYELMQLMTRVNRLVSKAETKKGLKQVSIFKSALTSDFYFFPGLQHGIVSSHSEMDMARIKKQDSASVQASAPQPVTAEQQAQSGASVQQPVTAEQQQQAQSGHISMGSGFTAQPSDDGDGGKIVW